jgi:hypothetical protein
MADDIQQPTQAPSIVIVDEAADITPADWAKWTSDGLRHALDALAALQSAQRCTRDGFASDRLDMAADEVRKAMKGMGA